MNCNKCGNVLKEGTLFCTTCGARIEEVDQTPAVNEAPAFNAAPANNPVVTKKRSALDNSVLFIGGSILVGSIVTGIINVLFSIIGNSIFGISEMQIVTGIVGLVCSVIKYGVIIGASFVCCKESLQQKISFVGVACIGLTVSSLVSSVLYSIANLFGLMYYYYAFVSPVISFITLVVSVLASAGIWIIFKKGNDFKKK